MEQIIKKLVEGRRLDEAKKKQALDTIASDLRTRLSGVSRKSHHKVDIVPNYDEGRVEITFRGTGDSFVVYPQKTRLSNDNSNKVIKVETIDGAYVEGTKVYDEEGNLLGDALVRTKATHSKSDYSESLEDAEYRFNSKITTLKKLESYVASEATNNMK